MNSPEDDLPPDDYRDHWHLDRRVPLAVLLALCVQTGGVVWWGATTSERMSNVERRLDAISPQADRLTRVEVKIDNIADSISEIKQAIRQPQENGRRTDGNR